MLYVDFFSIKLEKPKQGKKSQNTSPDSMWAYTRSSYKEAWFTVGHLWRLATAIRQCPSNFRLHSPELNSQILLLNTKISLINMSLIIPNIKE